MQAFQIIPGAGITGLKRVDAAKPTPGPREVLVRVHAAALNYRDLMFVRGTYPNTSDAAKIPVGDAAGEVVAVGEGVTRFKAGDKVINSYFPDWIDGEATPTKFAGTFGADVDGVLAEYFVANEQALVDMPANLNYVEASTLGCAGITAWNALFGDGDLKPGQTVLLLGTGGVSIWALQLAKASGLRAIITSSSDEKLARAKQLGADETINYRTTPEWQDEVLRLTGGRGVDLVVEVGGEGTLARSVKATRMGGAVAIVGFVSGIDGTAISPLDLILGAKRMRGVVVGSRAMMESVSALVQSADIRPVIDRVFDFEQAPQAFDYLDGGRHFGKVVVRVAG